MNSMPQKSSLKEDNKATYPTMTDHAAPTTEIDLHHHETVIDFLSADTQNPNNDDNNTSNYVSNNKKHPLIPTQVSSLKRNCPVKHQTDTTTTRSTPRRLIMRPLTYYFAPKPKPPKTKSRTASISTKPHRPHRPQDGFNYTATFAKPAPRQDAPQSAVSNRIPQQDKIAAAAYRKTVLQNAIDARRCNFETNQTKISRLRYKIDNLPSDLTDKAIQRRPPGSRTRRILFYAKEQYEDLTKSKNTLEQKQKVITAELADLRHQLANLPSQVLSAASPPSSDTDSEAFQNPPPDDSNDLSDSDIEHQYYQHEQKAAAITKRPAQEIPPNNEECQSIQALLAYRRAQLKLQQLSASKPEPSKTPAFTSVYRPRGLDSLLITNISSSGTPDMIGFIGPTKLICPPSPLPVPSSDSSTASTAAPTFFIDSDSEFSGWPTSEVEKHNKSRYRSRPSRRARRKKPQVQPWRVFKWLPPCTRAAWYAHRENRYKLKDVLRSSPSLQPSSIKAFLHRPDDSSISTTPSPAPAVLPDKPSPTKLPRLSPSVFHRGKINTAFAPSRKQVAQAPSQHVAQALSPSVLAPANPTGYNNPQLVLRIVATLKSWKTTCSPNRRPGWFTFILGILQVSKINNDSPYPAFPSNPQFSNYGKRWIIALLKKLQNVSWDQWQYRNVVSRRLLPTH